MSEEIVNPSVEFDNADENECESRSEPVITNDNYEGGNEPTDTTTNEFESRSEPANDPNDISALEDIMIEEELLNEMTSRINAEDDESFNKNDLDDEGEFFDNDDQDLLHRINNI